MGHSAVALMDREERLGCKTNRKHSVGMYVCRNNFHLYDKENYGTRLRRSPYLSSEVSFPESGQEWLIEFDFESQTLCLQLRVGQDWISATNHVDMKHSSVIPAFTLWSRDD